MSDNIDKMCFADLIKKGKIRIPQIPVSYTHLMLPTNSLV